MAQAGEKITIKAERLRHSSSISGDVWHGETAAPAYEWWYFDALSDDRRDALVIIFLSNFVFSPRYNRAAALHQSGQLTDASQFPALAVFYYRDGRPLFRAINEYAAEEFQASTTRPEGRIGHNSFRLVEAGAELRYEVNLRTTLRRQRMLQARLEWTVKAGDFFDEEKAAPHNTTGHHWNMVAPRCDVSGEIKLLEGGRETFHQRAFHGTGYHDHNRDTRWMPATIADWQWGRFHFQEATAVFYSYRERGHESQRLTRLYLIQDGSLSISAQQPAMSERQRNHFGLRYPSVLQFRADTAGDGPALVVRQCRVMDSSFFYLRFLSEATLEAHGGSIQHAAGITEHLAPRALSYRWLHWLINMRIGRNGHGAFLP